MTRIEEDETKTTTKKASVVERLIEPEKVFTDSFVTENIDGHKVNITRKVSTRKVQRIIYSDQVISINTK